MNIERINDNTIKLILTNHDIEARGYDSNTVWLNPTKSDQLFMEVLQEADEREYLEAEGLMWAYVRSLDGGVEIVVTRSDAMKEIEKMFSTMFEESNELDDVMSNLIDNADDLPFEFEEAATADEIFYDAALTYAFKDIDDIVPLAHRLIAEDIKSSLYSIDTTYYLAVDINDMAPKDIANIDAKISEYVAKSSVTIHYLEEYGKEIMTDNCFDTIVTHFA